METSLQSECWSTVRVIVSFSQEQWRKRPAYHDSLISSHVVPMVPGGITDDWTKVYALWHTQYVAPRFPMLLRWTKKYWRGREESGMKRFLLLISWVDWFDLGDTARVKNTYGGNRKLPEVRCMMWNSQTIDNEIIIKTNNHISILLFFWNLNIITLFKM